MSKNTPAIDQAIERHESYVKLDPGNAPLQLKLGELYFDAGRFEDAAAAFEGCLKAEPGHPVARSRCAGAFLALHRFGEAEQLLRGLLDEGHDDAALHHNLGLALYQQRLWEASAACFQAASEAGLDVPANLLYFARSLHHQGLTEEAIAVARRWHAQSPSQASSSYLALLYADDGRVDEGIDLARDALTQDAGDVDANVVAGWWSIEQQDTEAAMRHCEQALQREPDNGRAWLGIGLAHLHAAAHDDAIHALNRAVAIHPDNPGINVTLGWAKLVSRDFTGSEAVFRRAIEVDGRFAESHGGLATALAYQGRIKEAETSIQRAKRLDATSMGADIALTVVLAEKGQQQAGTDVFARMLERAPVAGGRTLRQHLQTYATRGQPATK
jgi:tetratricopeptide (TPR) repeat protein